MGRSFRGSKPARWRAILSLCVAIVAASVLCVGPAGAADEQTGPSGPSGASGPGVTTPPNSENAEPPTSRPPTTSTTRPKPKPKRDADGNDAAEDLAAPSADPTPTAGPPELARRGVLLPDDSLVAATEELNLERAKVEMLSRRRLQLDETVKQHETRLRRVRARSEEQQEQRLNRAVATYRGQSSGWRLGVIVKRQLSDERALYLVAAADDAARREIRRLERDGARLERQLRDERKELTEVEAQLEEALARLNRLLDKLAANNGTIVTLDGELVYVPTGPSPVAILADSADRELLRVMAAGGPLAGDARWTGARHTLAMELARASEGDRRAVADEIERDWDATPAPVLHATLFALRQVGKAYIYATAGPETFDCSGLTKAAYAQLRLGLPHFSGAQLHLGLPVLADALRPGDLLAYGPDGSEHVTMSIGGGLVVEAKGRAYGVIVAPERTDPAKGFAGATRILP
jgi:hypothetical protein